jgi:hypothetical protein
MMAHIGAIGTTMMAHTGAISTTGMSDIPYLAGGTRSVLCAFVHSDELSLRLINVTGRLHIRVWWAIGTFQSYRRKSGLLR